MSQIKCIVLIPLARNDGTPVRPAELRAILRRLLAEFGGYTVAGEVKGGWRAPSGVEYRDRNTEVWVLIERRQLPQLRRLVVEIGQQLGQEAMYLEVTEGVVEIIPVPRPGRSRKK